MCLQWHAVVLTAGKFGVLEKKRQIGVRRNLLDSLASASFFEEFHFRLQSCNCCSKCVHVSLHC